MVEIQPPSGHRTAGSPFLPDGLLSTTMIRVGDQVKWAFGRRWEVLAIDGDEAWVKSSDRCAPCKRTAPLRQLQFFSPLLEA